MEPTIIFEDQDIVVINKPAFLTVNRSDTTKNEKTLQDYVEENIEFSKVPEDSDFVKRSGIIHRLDKETSGIILMAKNEEVFYKMQNQFKERTIQKTYLALVHGIMEPENGEIQVPVGRLPWNRKRFGVIAGGRDSMTKYSTLKKFNFTPTGEKMTLLELYPKTGRTHQIRVHCKYSNHPIVSDTLYAGRKTARNDRNYLERVFLHAAKIQFEHPISHSSISFEAPLPMELTNFLKEYCTVV